MTFSEVRQDFIAGRQVFYQGKPVNIWKAADANFLYVDTPGLYGPGPMKVTAAELSREG